MMVVSYSWSVVLLYCRLKSAHLSGFSRSATPSPPGTTDHVPSSGTNNNVNKDLAAEPASSAQSGVAMRAHLQHHSISRSNPAGDNIKYWPEGSLSELSSLAYLGKSSSPLKPPHILLKGTTCSPSTTDKVPSAHQQGKRLELFRKPAKERVKSIGSRSGEADLGIMSSYESTGARSSVIGSHASVQGFMMKDR
jgi:hypothetical protein